MHTRGSVLLLTCALALAIGACGSSSKNSQLDSDNAQAIASDTTFSSQGDAARGEQVFIQCTVCHTNGGTQRIAPDLSGILTAEGQRLPENVDYGGKLPNGNIRTETNIVDWIKNGGKGKITVMAPQYLSDQQMADLLAYLRTLK